MRNLRSAAAESGRWVGGAPELYQLVRSLIGNQRMDTPEALLSFLSLVDTLPIMLGDPRKLSDEQRVAFQCWSGWFQGVKDRHQVMLFRRDLKGFGRPRVSAVG